MVLLYVNRNILANITITSNVGGKNKVVDVYPSSLRKVCLALHKVSQHLKFLLKNWKKIFFELKVFSFVSQTILRFHFNTKNNFMVSQNIVANINSTFNHTFFFRDIHS